jgi:Holliday junction resolvasome RuvABC endonuclease subunit
VTARVVGIDPSLTSTGLAAIYEDGAATTDTIITKGRTADDLATRGHRIRHIANTVLEWVVDDDLVVIESRFGSAGAGALDLTGLWWEIVNRLQRRDIPVVTFAPTSRAKYITGNGKADKAAVAAVVARMFPDVAITCSDEADALALAMVGAAGCHFPVPAVKCPEAAAAAKWPA